MAIDFGLGLRALQAYGEEASRDQQMQLNQQRAQQQAYTFDQGKRQDQARPQLVAQARRGNFNGAQDAALGGGDFDLAKVIGGMREDQLQQFQHQADIVGNLTPQLKAIPPEQRASVGAAALSRAGFTPEQLAGMDWSDAGLDMQYQLSAAGKAMVAARLKQQEAYTLAPGARRYSGNQMIADNPAAPKYMAVPEGGMLARIDGGGATSVLGGPGDYAPQGMQPQMGGGGPLSAMTAITAQAESGNRDYLPNGQLVTSPKGAQGAMQTMPGTQADPGYGVAPVRDGSVSEKNRVGREYLEAMMRKYGGDTRKAWAAYNAGPGRVDQAIAQRGEGWLAAMPGETRAYVARNGQRLAGRQDAPDSAPSVIYGRPKTSEQSRRMTPQEVQAEGLDSRTVYYRGKDGVPQAVSGQEKKQVANLTAEQTKSVGLLGRMVAAQNSLNTITGYTPNSVALALNDLSNKNPIKANISQVDRRVLNAQLAFANAILRQESGAAIGVDEAAKMVQTLFPMPGDGPEVQADKRAQREAALAGMRAAAGPGASTVARVKANPNDRKAPGYRAPAQAAISPERLRQFKVIR